MCLCAWILCLYICFFRWMMNFDSSLHLVFIQVSLQKMPNSYVKVFGCMASFCMSILGSDWLGPLLTVYRVRLALVHHPNHSELMSPTELKPLFLDRILCCEDRRNRREKMKFEVKLEWARKGVHVHKWMSIENELFLSFNFHSDCEFGARVSWPQFFVWRIFDVSLRRVSWAVHTFCTFKSSED